MIQFDVKTMPAQVPRHPPEQLAMHPTIATSPSVHDRSRDKARDHGYPHELQDAAAGPPCARARIGGRKNDWVLYTKNHDEIHHHMENN
jgi:hypothetical protein